MTKDEFNKRTVGLNLFKLSANVDGLRMSALLYRSQVHTQIERGLGRLDSWALEGRSTTELRLGDWQPLWER